MASRSAPEFAGNRPLHGPTGPGALQSKARTSMLVNRGVGAYTPALTQDCLHKLWLVRFARPMLGPRRIKSHTLPRKPIGSATPKSFRTSASPKVPKGLSTPSAPAWPAGVPIVGLVGTANRSAWCKT